VLDDIRRRFKPRSTVQAVVEELVVGLRNGTIVLDREKDASAGSAANGVAGSAKVPAVLVLCGELSMEERLSIMEQLAAALPPEVSLRFAERLQCQSLATRDGGNGADGDKRP
jgi:hypothetical protein